MAAETFKVGQRVRLRGDVLFGIIRDAKAELHRVSRSEWVPVKCLRSPFDGTTQFIGDAVVVRARADRVMLEVDDPGDPIDAVPTRCVVPADFLEAEPSPAPKWHELVDSITTPGVVEGVSAKVFTLPAPLEPGDVVRLASGGPAMTLHGTEGDLAFVVWWEEGKVRWEDVPLSALVRCEPDPK